MVKKIRNYLKTLRLVLLNSPTIKLYGPSIKTKRIILCVDGKTKHGGFVDRLKGIISFYEVAKATNRDFFIHYTEPFLLEDYLMPNKVDWRLKSGMEWNPWKSKFIVAYNNFNYNPFDVIQNNETETIIVYCNVDYTNAKSGVDSSTHQIRWKKSFDELFVWSNTLLQKQNALQFNTIFHTRFTNLLGDFIDTTNVVLDEKEKLKLVDKVIDSMKKVAKDEEEHTLVLSDSLTFLNAVKEQTDFKILKGNPLHMDMVGIDKSTADVVTDHEKTLLDFMILSRAKNITLFQIDGMYNSSFSRYASYLGNATFKNITQVQ